MLRQCVEHHVEPSWFYVSAHGTIFETLTRMLQEKKPISVPILAEELKMAKHLEAIGGYAFLTQVSSHIPTTAQAGYFIEKVREQALLRATIRTATSITEDAYSFSGGIDDFLAENEQRIRSLTETSAPPSAIREWATRRAGIGRVLKPEVPCLYLCDVPISHRSNLGMITALQKSGKSAVGGAILGAIIAGPNQRGDTLRFRAHNEHGHAVLHLDTEQSPADHETLIAIAKRRAGVEELPPWLYSFGVKGVCPEQLRQRLPRLLRELKRAHGGVFFVLLDGAADFVNDTNDPKECNPFVTDLESYATDFDCSLVSVLHLNPTKGDQPTKSRGHLGSQLERKCETDLRLVKDADGITTIFTASARHAPIFEKDGPRFSWDTAAEMHLSLEQTAGRAREFAEAESLRDLAADVFGDRSAMRYSDLISALETTRKCSERTAGRKFDAMKSHKIITRFPPNLWAISGRPNLACRSMVQRWFSYSRRCVRSNPPSRRVIKSSMFPSARPATGKFESESFRPTRIASFLAWTSASSSRGPAILGQPRQGSDSLGVS